MATNPNKIEDKGFVDTTKKLALAVTNHYSDIMGQAGRTAHAISRQRGLVLFNSDGSLKLSSAMSNPPRVHEDEKFDVLEKLHERVKTNLSITQGETIPEYLTKGVAQFAINSKLAADFVDLGKTAAGILMEILTCGVKISPLKVNGWRIERFSEVLASIVKMRLVHAETIIRHEAPIHTIVGIQTSTESHLNTNIHDIHLTVVKDEIHRIANVFGLDAKKLALLVKETASLQAQQKIEFSSGREVEISAAAKILNKAGTSIKSSAPLHIITDGAGGTITMSAGIINLNPLSSSSSEIPNVVLPVTNVEANAEIRATDMRPQFQNMNGHGTQII